MDCDWISDFMDFFTFHEHGEDFLADIVLELRREERDELKEGFNREDFSDIVAVRENRFDKSLKLREDLGSFRLLRRSC